MGFLNSVVLGCDGVGSLLPSSRLKLTPKMGDSMFIQNTGNDQNECIASQSRTAESPACSVLVTSLYVDL